MPYAINRYFIFICPKENALWEHGYVYTSKVEANQKARALKKEFAGVQIIYERIGEDEIEDFIIKTRRKLNQNTDLCFTLYRIKNGEFVATDRDFAVLAALAAKEFALTWNLPEGRYFLQWNKEILRDSEFLRVVDDASGTYRIVTNNIY